MLGAGLGTLLLGALGRGWGEDERERLVPSGDQLSPRPNPILQKPTANDYLL